MKAILKPFRLRARYVIISNFENTNLNKSITEITQTYKQYFGEIDFYNAGIKFISNLDSDKKNKKLVIKINHNYIHQLKSSLTLCKLNLKSDKICGTIKKAKQELKNL